MYISRNRLPEKVKEVDKNLKGLYYTGELSLIFEPCVTIVGTRKPTDYGLRQTWRMVHRLVACGYVIVSGFALGIDAMAHRAALAAGGKTIAIIGCGIDIDYPKANRDLRDRIPLFLSEYPQGVHPQPSHFPKRNRLLSAFGDYLLIPECDIASGTMITAQYGLEQGKDIWVIPGDIDRSQSRGCNYLIFQGANPLYDIGLICKEDTCQKISSLSSHHQKPKPSPNT